MIFRVLKEYYKKAQDGANKITLTLKFNDKESLFYSNEMINDEDVNFAKIFTETDDVYFTEQNSVIISEWCSKTQTYINDDGPIIFAYVSVCKK